VLGIVKLLGRSAGVSRAKARWPARIDRGNPAFNRIPLARTKRNGPLPMGGVEPSGNHARGLPRALGAAEFVARPSVNRVAAPGSTPAVLAARERLGDGFLRFRIPPAGRLKKLSQPGEFSDVFGGQHGDDYVGLW
jgi:hypothetical protein